MVWEGRHREVPPYPDHPLRCCGGEYVAVIQFPFVSQRKALNLRNIFLSTYNDFKKAIKPLSSFHGRSGSGVTASHSAIALAFVSRSISA